MELTDLVTLGEDAPVSLLLAVLIWRLESRLARIEKAFDILGERLLPQVKK